MCVFPHRARRIPCLSSFHAGANTRGEPGASTTGRTRERTMNNDQVEGRIDTAKGKVKKAVGKAVGNKKMEKEGVDESAHGKARAKFGDVMNVIEK